MTTPQPTASRPPVVGRAPLVIAAHGTRVPAGQAACRALIARVATMLPDVDVRGAYVELDAPPIADAVADALDAAAGDRVVVVPLMVGQGGHVLADIPEEGERGRGRHPGSHVTYAAHLGAGPELRSALRQRIDAAASGWGPADVAVVVLGRGCSVTGANADHVRLARVVGEEGGYGITVPAFIQVVRPTLTDALTQAYAVGFRRIVVGVNFLFPGRLHDWAAAEIERWLGTHPDARVRLADVIGDCDELAGVVVERYRQAASADPDAGSPVYLAGLHLTGRRVLLVGAGRVATRRVDRLLQAGAAVTVVAPTATPHIASLAAEGRIVWHRREFTDDDLEGCWYVLALTDRPATNSQVAAGAEARHTFCVRGDDALGGSAWTPASGLVAGLTVGVVGDRDPHRSARARTVAVDAVADWVTAG